MIFIKKPIKNMYKNFNITEEERQQIMEMHQSHGYKKPVNEQSLSALGSGGGPMWYEKFGCIADGIDGLKKVQTDNGAAFEYTGPKGRIILFNDQLQKANPELAKKVTAVNPNVKHIGKGMNLKTKEEVVFYCTRPVRGGIRVVGKNDTVEPPRQAKPVTPSATNAQVAARNAAIATK